MNRIEALYSFISEDDKVVDVGCDQAKLALMLSKRGQSSIASDISENVIKKARENIKSDLIDLRVSDGLDNIKEGEANTLVLSGMGTHTIIEILKKTKLKFDKIITISNNYHDVLRDNMNKLDYKVKEELIIKENNKYYNLIIFVPGNYNYNDSELMLGINHKDKDMYTEYLNYLLDKYNKIKLSSKDKNLKVDFIIELLKNKISA